MPFTPFHFGPSASLAFPLKKHLNIPVFVLANVVIDLEPLTVMVLNLNYPVHGYFHTLIGGILVGTCWGIIASFFSKSKLSTLIFSWILGFWFHIFLDSFMHADIKPFYPFSYNPFYQAISTPHLYLICTLFFIPALIFFIREIFILRNKRQEK